MAITRRQFLKCSGLATAGGIFGPSLFGAPWLQRAFAETIGDRYVIVIDLDGGNDGLNTVTPADNGLGTLRTAYEAARDLNAGTGGIGLTSGQLGNTLIGLDPNTNCQLAIHPAMTGLKSLYDLGKVAVVQNCGYPDYNLSHDVANTIWRSGDPLGALAGSTGWMGRYLTTYYGANDIPAVCVRGSVAGEFLQTGTSVLAIERLSRFGFPFDTEDEYEDDEELQGGDEIADRDRHRWELDPNSAEDTDDRD